MKASLGITILAAGLVLAVVPASAQKQTAESMFRDALMKERAEGNLHEAIFRYERLIVEFPKDRQFAAQALYQLAQAYEKLGDPRAKLMLTRLSRDYASVEPSPRTPAPGCWPCSRLEQRSSPKRPSTKTTSSARPTASWPST